MGETTKVDLSFKDRLEQENSDLEEKIIKLNTFVCTEAFNKIDPLQMSLLKIQLQAMITYNQCLNERLVNLK